MLVQDLSKLCFGLFNFNMKDTELYREFVSSYSSKVKHNKRVKDIRKYTTIKGINYFHFVVFKHLNSFHYKLLSSKFIPYFSFNTELYFIQHLKSNGNSVSNEYMTYSDSKFPSTSCVSLVSFFGLGMFRPYSIYSNTSILNTLFNYNSVNINSITTSLNCYIIYQGLFHSVFHTSSFRELSENISILVANNYTFMTDIGQHVIQYIPVNNNLRFLYTYGHKLGLFLDIYSSTIFKRSLVHFVKALPYVGMGISLYNIDITFQLLPHSISVIAYPLEDTLDDTFTDKLFKNIKSYTVNILFDTFSLGLFVFCPYLETIRQISSHIYSEYNKLRYIVSINFNTTLFVN